MTGENNKSQITLTNNLPKGGSRTNGAATESYYLGNFRFDEYQNSKVFLYIKYPPYLVIKLKDKTVLYNTKVKDKTLEYYQRLLELKKQ